MIDLILDPVTKEELAFPVTREALQPYFKDASKRIFNFHVFNITPEIN
ncbi:MAG: hypothetical protein R6W88_15700 [Desulfobacterales bacterium]